MDLDATANIMIRRSIGAMPSTPIPAILESLMTTLTTVLAQYRTHCASNGALNHLILPETLRLLPLYINSFLKKHVLRKEKATAADLRVANGIFICSSSLYTLTAYLYPKLYWLSPYVADEESQVGLEVEGGHVILPNCQPLLIETLEDTGLYIVDNGQTIFIVVFNECQILYEVFGVTTIDEVSNLEEFPMFEEMPANLKVHAIIGELRKRKSEAYQDLRILTFRNFPLDSFFDELLIEEECCGIDGYGNFLAYLHRLIQQK